MDRGRLEPLLQRHADYWKAEARVLLEEVGTYQPLRARADGQGLPLADGSRSTEGQLLTPELIDPARFYEHAGELGSPLRGDFLAGLAPPHLCWTEAVLGCAVRMIRGGPWAEPFAQDWRAPGRIAAGTRWLDKLEHFTRLLAQRAGGRCPVMQPLMRGPVDMMASAMGHEAACVALLAEPAAAGDFLARCSELFMEAARRQVGATPRFAGGYVSSYGIWAPGTVVRTQIDNATMLSPALYRERVLPHDRAVIEQFEFPLIHVHSGCLHVVDALLEVEALRAIQVSIDHPGGPLAAQVMQTLERIVARKPLIVTGPVTPQELTALRGLARLGSVCLRVQVHSGQTVV